MTIICGLAIWTWPVGAWAICDPVAQAPRSVKLTSSTESDDSRNEQGVLMTGGLLLRWTGRSSRSSVAKSGNPGTKPEPTQVPTRRALPQVEGSAVNLRTEPKSEARFVSRGAGGELLTVFPFSTTVPPAR
jgi:hypothetical protein